MAPNLPRRDVTVAPLSPAGRGARMGAAPDVLAPSSGEIAPDRSACPIRAPGRLERFLAEVPVHALELAGGDPRLRLGDAARQGRGHGQPRPDQGHRRFRQGSGSRILGADGGGLRGGLRVLGYGEQSEMMSHRTASRFALPIDAPSAVRFSRKFRKRERSQPASCATHSSCLGRHAVLRS